MIAMWRVVVPGALIQSTISTAALAMLLHLVGWTWIAGIVLGMAISVASTVVMALVLAERHDLHGRIGYIAIGWTVVEDLLTVGMLLLLPIIFAPGGGAGQSVGFALAMAGLKVAGLVAVVVVLGRWVIPTALERIEKTRSRELFTLAVLVLAVGIAVGSATLFGVSMALGAFLAGLAVGRRVCGSRCQRCGADARRLRRAVLCLGRHVVRSPESHRGAVADRAGVGGGCDHQTLAALLTVRILGEPSRQRSRSAPPSSGWRIQLHPRLARSRTRTDQRRRLECSGSCIHNLDRAESFHLPMARRRSSVTPDLTRVAARQHPAIDPRRCILVGYGPVGKIVRRLLEERGALDTVNDLNLETIRRLRAEGRTAIYGDVLRPGTLDEAGIATAGSLVLSADIEDAAEIIRQSRLLNPDLRVLVRCTHLRDAAALQRAGANVVAAGEAEVGVALAEAVTAEDRMEAGEAAEQRRAIRSRLYSSPTAG
jgi:CPA2 family monovalent cation:H+ antiporter-2